MAHSQACLTGILHLQGMKKNHQLVKLGQKIRRIRESKDYSQEAFAAEAEIDRSYMGGVERGERNISVVNLIKIAKALKVEVGDLFPSIKELNSPK
jgi:transcriptional regulator with XRE-family HTH domain